MRYVSERHIVIDGAPTPTPFWVPDRSFAGATVAIIGGGPSLADLDLDLLAGHRFIAVNSGCRKVRPIATSADPLYFSDDSWNVNRPELAAAWPGPVITCNRNTKMRLGDAVRYLDVSALCWNFQVQPDCLQASSGHVAASLAVAMGAERLVLIAFEGRLVDGRSHGHDDYREQDGRVYVDRFVPSWRPLAAAFAERRVRVINATPVSAIDDFERMPLADALGEG